MISIVKEAIIPNSIAFPPPTTNATKARNTHLRARLCVIASKSYPKKNTKFDKCYKQTDIKLALKKIYNRKCAYCERKLGKTIEVEHYRPKSIYYWLAYSWDNLLLICRDCNTAKLDTFDIQNTTRATYKISDLPNIHTLCSIYNTLELPLLLNPEQDDLTNLWIFSKDGKMDSNDVRGQYTIKTLDLNNADIQDDRKEIVDDFVEEMNNIIRIHFENIPHLLARMQEHINIFTNHSFNSKKEFLAFRRYVVSYLIETLF